MWGFGKGARGRKASFDLIKKVNLFLFNLVSSSKYLSKKHEMIVVRFRSLCSFGRLCKSLGARTVGSTGLACETGWVREQFLTQSPTDILQALVTGSAGPFKGPCFGNIPGSWKHSLSASYQAFGLTTQGELCQQG